ncbi:MAG: LysM peptidoglycan-binding domain-containing protein, partial [Thermoanaerobaculia bacterium]|nr:LysM peptidoglycan-binding domain-containing protein [Thermoanaerobaculia bacterium]
APKQPAAAKENNSPEKPGKNSGLSKADNPVPVLKQEEAGQFKQYQWHTVRRNESLDDIARQYGTPPDVLRKLNNCESITIGMRLKVKEL